MKFLLDENLSPLHARTLCALGYDAVSVVELGLSGAADSAVRAVAIEAGRILVTLDADFGNVLRYPPAATPGVIRFRLHPATEEAIDAALRWAVPRLAQISLLGNLSPSARTGFGSEVEPRAADGRQHHDGPELRAHPPPTVASRPSSTWARSSPTPSTTPWAPGCSSCR